ncbi:MAG: hypothetical protein RML72_07295, partial [Bacteroidia bacterium]|nr:hypothetical protein [Bacteroidia bacterium]
MFNEPLWKRAFPPFFLPAIYYFLPALAQDIDPQAPIEFLQQEFLAPSSSAARIVDILAQVKLKNQQPYLVLVHVEIQGYNDPTFAQRMFSYFCRIKEKYPTHNIVALALFTDDNPHYHPTQYHYAFYGTEVLYKYNTFKLLSKKVEELYVEGNPFSLVLQVARVALERRRKGLERWKLAWLKRLIQEFRKQAWELEQVRVFLYFVVESIKGMQLENQQ